MRWYVGDTEGGGLLAMVLVLAVLGLVESGNVCMGISGSSTGSPWNIGFLFFFFLFSE